MKHFLIALTIAFLGMGTAAADVDQYIGKWTNPYAAADVISQMVFKGHGGGKIDVHVWGKCTPQDCDWGWENCNSYADGHLSARYQNNFSVRDLTINMVNISTLNVKVHTRYTDNSGRPTRDDTYRRYTGWSGYEKRKKIM